MSGTQRFIPDACAFRRGNKSASAGYQIGDDAKSADPLAGARTVDSVIERARMEGCFLQNCAIELAHRDAEAQVVVGRGLRRLEKAYYEVVVRGQEAGEIRKSADARILARYLAASLNGLQTLARVERDRTALRQVAQTALSVLE